MKRLIANKIFTTAVAGLLFLSVAVTTAAALDLGDILKVGGIAYLVDRYDKQIDEFINRALGEREAQAKGATKVVPIVSIGQGGYIGAAQIVGVPSGIEKTKAVLQLEMKIGDFRGTGMIPVTTKTPDRNPDRVKGVGVSAVVDFKI